MTQVEFAKVWNVLLLAFPDAKGDTNTMQLYYRMLADLPAAAVEAAVTKHVSSSKWFPRISELLPPAHNPLESWVRGGIICPRCYNRPCHCADMFGLGLKAGEALEQLPEPVRGNGHDPADAQAVMAAVAARKRA